MTLGPKNVLITGSGGREHALERSLKNNNDVGKVYHAPGGGGTSNNTGIGETDLPNLLRFARQNDCLTVMGSEAPSARGIADAFIEAGLPIVAPTRKAAMLESHKIFAKKFMEKNEILTPSYEIFDNPEEAKAYARLHPDCVVKADGLCKGKGVTVCDTSEEAIAAIDEIMVQRKFGDAGDMILIEERLRGEEASYIVLTDGKSYIPLATSQDHKRLLDGDKGPNTGGMGAYSPTPVITPGIEHLLQKRFVEPTITGMASAGTPISGFLYLGVMVVQSATGPVPYLLEYNVRLGDPEAQAILFRLESELFPYLDAVANGNLGRFNEMSWNPKSSVTVVMAAKGYPDDRKKFIKREPIQGLEFEDPNSFVFHSSTVRKNGRILTSGSVGRILSATALGPTLPEAASNAYKRVAMIRPEMHFRRDIAKKGIEMLRREGN
jgi:phosphoribosylamine--glycine ligase